MSAAALPTRSYAELRALRRRGACPPAAGPCWNCGRNGAQDRPSYDHCHLHDYVRGVLCHGCNIQMAWVDARAAVAAGDWRIAYWGRCPRCAAAGPWQPLLTRAEYLRAGGREFVLALGSARPRDRLMLISQAADSYPWMVGDLIRQREDAALGGLSLTGLRRLRRMLRAGAKDVAEARRGPETFWLPEYASLERELRSLAEWAAAVIRDREG